MQAPVKLSRCIMLTLNCLVWLFAGYHVGIHLRAWHDRLEAKTLVPAPCAPQVPFNADGPYYYYHFRPGSQVGGSDEGVTPCTGPTSTHGDGNVVISGCSDQVNVNDFPR